MAEPGAGPDERAHVERELGLTRALTIPHTPSPGLAPVTFGQERLLSFEEARVGDGPCPYNEAILLHLRGTVDDTRIRMGLDRIAARHEAWRTTFHFIEGRSRQLVRAQATVPFEARDWSALDETSARQRLDELMRAEARRPFDMATGPLVRAFGAHLGPQHYALLISTHHAVMDSWSIAIVVRELSEALASAVEAPALTVQCRDYALWEEGRRAEILATQLPYWQTALAGATALALPHDLPRPPQFSFRGAMHRVHVPPAMTRRLERLVAEESSTLTAALLALYALVLGRWAGQSDVLTGIELSARRQIELEQPIGFHVATLPARIDLSGRPPFRALCRRALGVILAAQQHSEVPLERVVALVDEPRDPAKNPLFQTVFAFEQSPPTASRIGDADVFVEWPDNGVAKFDLSLILEARDGGLSGVLSYATDLWQPQTIARFESHFLTLLGKVLDAPDTPVEELTLLSAEEERALVRAGLPRGSLPWRGSLPQRFAEQVWRAPHRPAVTAGDSTLSYQELDARSDGLAARLRRAGASVGARIALHLPRGIDLVVGVMGILKCGAAYVPVEPDAAATERTSYIVRDAGATLVVTDETHRADFALPTVLVAGPAEPFDAVTLGPDDAAYVIYTSGSTGAPKGVVVSHAAVTRLIDACGEPIGSSYDDVFSCTHSIAFDVSVAEIWGALLGGGRVVVVAQAVARQPTELLALLARERVTILSQTPSAFAMLEPYTERGLPPSLRMVLFAGEALTARHLARFIERHGDERPAFVNLYGITETTVHSTWHRVRRAELTNPRCSIGVPLFDLSLHLLDEALRPVPVGVPGEIFVGGPGLAQGYIGRPADTAARFVPDPFAAEPGRRLYRSGDQAMRRSDGTIEIRGRLDRQLKIRGHRVEPSEVEAALCAQPGVVAAVAVPHDDGGGTRLYAFWVARDGASPSSAELLSAIRARLPTAWIPAALLRVDALPLTRNGKTDQRALSAQIARGTTLVAGPADPPLSPVEAELVSMWQSLLRVDGVGRHDDFFQLGGDSLLAVRLVAAARARWGVNCSLRSFFNAPTVAVFAELVTRHLAAPTPAVTDAIPPAPVDRVVFASAGQERLWLLEQLRLPGGVCPYNEVIAVTLSGALDIEALKSALDGVVQAQASWRTVFPAIDGRPTLKVLADLRLPLLSIEGGTIAELARAEARRPFDIEAGPLCRLFLLPGGPREHTLLISVHHLVFDRGSVPALLRQLDSGYRAHRAGEAVPTAAPAITFRDFAAWQASRRDALVTQQLPYWQERLAGATVDLPLPLDHVRPARFTFQGAHRTFFVAAETVARLRELCDSAKVTMPALLLGAYAALLGRYARQSDVVLGVTLSERVRRELDDVIGFFVTTVPVRLSLAAHPDAVTLAQRAQVALAEAQDHSEVPLDRIVGCVEHKRDASRNPLFQTAFSFQRAPDLPTRVGELRVHAQPVPNGIAKFDLALGLEARDGGLAGMFEWATDLFDEATVAAMEASLLRLLAAMVEKPQRAVAQAPLVAPRQPAPITSRRAGTLAERFSAQCARTPAAVAASDGNQELTYAQLDRRASRLARRLLACGVRPEMRVALHLPRTVDLIVGLVGILKAGAAYVPIEIGVPPERLRFVVGDAGVEVAVTDSARAATLLPLVRDVVRVGFDAEGEPEAYQHESFSVAVTPSQLAYVIYTSGSTGSPKGVEVEHGMAEQLFASTSHLVAFDEPQVWSLFHSIAFDFSVWELWGALLHGGRVVVVPREVARSPEAFFDLLARERVSVLSQTPSAFAQLSAVAVSRPRLASLRTIVIGGESYAPRLLGPWMAHYGDSSPALYQVYGITEATVLTTARRMTRSDLGGRPASFIGTAFSGMEAHILDEELQPTPIGAIGEIHVGGSGVARGYRGRAADTAARFVPDPFVPGARLYRSGDLARRLTDGSIEFLGRADQQLKIRGYRIEPGEIEAALGRYPGVAASVVAARSDVTGRKRLVAWWVPAGAAASEEELRAHLSALLPDHLVPSRLIPVVRLPLNASGKIDHAALPDAAPAPPPVLATATAETHEARVVRRIWCELLERAHIDAQARFLDLGGDSLLAVRVLSRIRSELGVAPALHEFFDAPTVEALAASSRRLRLLAAIARVRGEVLDAVSHARAQRADADLEIELASLSPRR